MKHWKFLICSIIIPAIVSPIVAYIVVTLLLHK